MSWKSAGRNLPGPICLSSIRRRQGNRMRPMKLLALTLSLVTGIALAQAPNDPNKVKPIPPPGNELAAADRAELEAGVSQLGKDLDALKSELTGKPELLALLPDIQIYHN